MTRLSLNESRLLAMYDQNPDNAALCVYNPATLTNNNFYPNLFQHIVRALVAKNADLRVRYEKTSSGWQRDERELLPAGAYVPIYENATDNDRDAFGKKNFKPNEQGALFQMAVFCYPDGKTCIDFRGSHLIIDAASARVLYSMIEYIYKWAALSYHPYFPVIAQQVARAGAWFLYRSHDEQAIVTRRADARAALDDSDSATNQYWKALYEDKQMSYLPSADLKEKIGLISAKGFSHAIQLNDHLHQHVSAFLKFPEAFKGVHFWLASLALYFLSQSNEDCIEIPVRIPLARVGLDVGYNSTETVIILSADDKQNLLDVCDSVRSALRASKHAQQFPVLQGMGKYAPKIAVNYIEANSDLHLGKSAVARLDRERVTPVPGQLVDCWYEKSTYPIEYELGIYPNDGVVTSVASTAHHTSNRGQDLLQGLLQVALWAAEHPRTAFEDADVHLSVGSAQH